MGFGESYTGARERLARDGYDHAFAELRGLLANVDAVVANLETPLTELTRSPLAGQKQYLHRADPTKATEVLARLRISNLSLANNHSLDYGVAGLETTLRSLAQHGLHTFGAGADAAAARQPRVLETRLGDRAIRIAVFGSFQLRRSYQEIGFYAGDDRPGVSPLSEDTLAAIRSHRKAHPIDFIVAYPHWGPNYRWRTPEQADQAGSLLAAGADLVIGHGAHRLQEIERRDGRWILYNLGNFAFNSPGRYAEYGAPPFSLVARLRFRLEGNDVRPALRVHGILSDNLKTGYRPRPLHPDEFERALVLLEERSGGTWGLGAGVRRGSDAIGDHLELDLDRLRYAPAP